MDPNRLDIVRVLQETFVARAEHHPTLPSTNDRAMRAAAEAPEMTPLLVVADRQTAGRGRGTHRWWTGPGSLAMSLVVDAGRLAACRRDLSPLVSLAAAVAVVETVEPQLPGHRVGIYWPNDVVADGKKLAGILVEVLPNARHVIGIGVNTNNTLAGAPAELQGTATTMRELTAALHDQTTTLITLLGKLKSAFDRCAAEPDWIGRRADALCLQHGETLTLRLGHRTITGRCGGIAPDGALLLDTPQGRESFYSGVFQR
ncbi:MAG: biotin--[acetyl-CoA-carboxylase] ligase [Pirellulales bacterium]|nr:biotin--[acetyl-CoA-carboxylase] ligase [Pirellulales bacterium]